MVSTTQSNVICARGIYDCLMTNDFNLIEAQENANKIYLSALAAIQTEVKGQSNVNNDWIPVVVELNKITGLENIQHSFPLLNSLLKAHRTAVEIVWVNCWHEEVQHVYPETRENLLQIAQMVKQNLPRSTIIKGRTLLSYSEALYEVSCLKQASKCLALRDQILTGFSEKFADALPELISNVNMVAIFPALIQVARSAHHEMIASWYIDMFSLEWLATNITTIEAFQNDIEPRIEEFKNKGDKHTLGLVKIFTLILQNQENTPELKERVFTELLALIAIIPTYSVKETLRHPEQLFSKIIQKPDRYAATRNFAISSLLDFVAKEENFSYRARIKEAVEKWIQKITDQSCKVYLQEKEIAKNLLAKCDEDIVVLQKKFESLNQEIKTLGLGPTRTVSTSMSLDEHPLCDDLVEYRTKEKEAITEKEILQNEIALANAFEALQNEETCLLGELLSHLKEW